MNEQSLKVKTTKNKVIVSSKEKVIANFMDCKNVDLELVQNSKYLGVTLSENGRSEEAPRAKINTA